MSLSERRRQIIAMMQSALIEAIKKNGQASADDIRAAVKIPDDISPSITGTAVRLLSKDKVIVVVSIGTTARRCAHARLTRFWRLADPQTGGDAL